MVRTNMNEDDVLPASAGMILSQGDPTTLDVSAPRIRGDDPWARPLAPIVSSCSPHPRG